MNCAKTLWVLLVASAVLGRAVPADAQVWPPECGWQTCWNCGWDYLPCEPCASMCSIGCAIYMAWCLTRPYPTFCECDCSFCGTCPHWTCFSYSCWICGDRPMRIEPPVEFEEAAAQSLPNLDLGGQR